MSSPETASEVDEISYVDPKLLADLHAENERLGSWVRELESQLNQTRRPTPSHYDDSRMIEAQSRYIESREQVTADLLRSRRDIKRRVQELEDQLDSARAVDGEKIRARDARIWQLEEELTASNRIIGEVWTRLHDGEIGDAIDELRCDINMLVEEQSRELGKLEAVIDLGDDDLGEHLVTEFTNKMDHMRNSLAKEVQCVELGVDKLEVLVQTAARTIIQEE